MKSTDTVREGDECSPHSSGLGWGPISSSWWGQRYDDMPRGYRYRRLKKGFAPVVIGEYTIEVDGKRIVVSDSLGLIQSFTLEQAKELLRLMNQGGPKIGDYDVTRVAINSAKVGCTKITRPLVERIIKQLES